MSSCIMMTGETVFGSQVSLTHSFCHSLNHSVTHLVEHLHQLCTSHQSGAEAGDRLPVCVCRPLCLCVFLIDCLLQFAHVCLYFSCLAPTFLLACLLSEKDWRVFCLFQILFLCHDLCLMFIIIYYSTDSLELKRGNQRDHAHITFNDFHIYMMVNINAV